MNRRQFFRLTAGAVATAAVAPHIAKPAVLRVRGTYHGLTDRVHYDLTDSDHWYLNRDLDKLRECARWLGESTRRKQEQMMAEFFKDGAPFA